MNRLLNKYPLIYNKPTSPARVISLDRGKQIMEGMLLNQYQNSPNLKAYYMCFIEELNLLLQQTEEVYYGRFLENAIGEQLNIIGDILNQPRSVYLPTVYFGFQGALDVDGMSDEATPAEGGIFKDGNSAAVVTPLDDETYRKVLISKALLMNSDTADINSAYYIIGVLLGKIPRVLSIQNISKREIELTVNRDSITNREVVLILYMSKYFVPAGISFTIKQVI